ncbi:hypothetical protein [Herpetosiphon giganteus]|uniref:hypothetical protein n=1 Tax=Herpetosiphon giganteus TaxID=2029754 RepID=UPI00195D7E7D|nr:hypothetical protein [Herpetosiphon giganteus]MBM7842840.1 hypothetical protein [Herpetosiphon giganteus]
MYLLSINMSGLAIGFFFLIGVGILILGMNIWLLVLLGSIQAMPRNHAKAAWGLITINLLEPIITSCWLVAITLIKGHDFYRSLWTIAETLWGWEFLTGSSGQSNVEILLYCLKFYWPMLLCLVVVPMLGLLSRNHTTSQTARLSLKYGFLRIYGVYIALIVVQMSIYFPILIGAFGLSIYTYRSMYQHAKTILQHPIQALTMRNQQLAIGSTNPETSHIATNIH